MGLRTRTEQIRAALAGARSRLEEAQREGRFASSPVGQARTAFDEGAELFQVSFGAEVYQGPYFRVGARAAAFVESNGPTQTLNAVRREGWELLTASFVHETNGSLSGDSTSGYSMTVSGTTMGHYVFRRAEELRVVEPEVQLDGADDRD